MIYILSPDPSTAQLLSQVIQSAGYNCQTISDRQQIAQLATDPESQMIILDQKFEKGGWESVAYQLELDAPSLPVVLITTKENQDVLEKAIAVGIRGIIVLPGKPDEILKVIERNLQKSERLHMFDPLRAQVKTDLKTDRKELVEFTHIAKHISRSLELDDVFKDIVDAAINLTGAEEGSLLLYDDQAKELIRCAGKTFRDEMSKTFRQKVQDTTAGEVIRTGKPFLLTAENSKQFLTFFLVKSLIYVPLILKDRVIGVLGVDNHTRVGNVFTDQDVKLLSLLAEYAVIGIQNAKLYMDTTGERNRLSAILSEIKDGILLLDPTWHLRLTNPVSRRVLGLHDDDLGKSINQVIKNEPLLRFIQGTDGQIKNWFELEVGENVVYEVRVTQVPATGRVVTFHDVTDMKKLNQVKTDLVNTVSHDLRSPLTTIYGYAELLERVGSLNDQQKEFTQKIRKGVKNITQMVNNLLDLERIDSYMITNREQVLLQNIIVSSIETLERQIGDKKLDVSNTIPAGLPSIRANPMQMQQLFDNLLGNSVKYTPEKGKIVLSARQEEDQIIIRISDSGIGIPTTDLPHIFEKFYRGSNVNEQVSGTGLGLAIVSRIIDAHNGRIWVESNQGKGSTFTIVLPQLERSTDVTRKETVDPGK
jgi:signal transduction histidine kinase/DNA-binding NarL/FixJ family response regulator